MKLGRNAIRKLIQEEIESLDYDRTKNVSGSPIEHENTFDVDTYEDSWAGGENIHNNINHLKTGGSKESDVLGIERLTHKTSMKESTSSSKKELNAIILEEFKKVSELKEFARSRGGKKFEQAGQKIESAGSSIRELANEQTGSMRETLNHVSEFVEKLGHSIRSVNDLDEDTSAESTLPTVAELKKLIKSIKRLEK